MVVSLEPCCCLSNYITQTTSIVISCCQKKQAAPNEKSKFGFKLLSSLPEHILLEILIRLPTKKAHIFKLVCRRWCSLICSSHFISKFIHLRRQRHSADTPNSFTLLFQHEIRTPTPDEFIEELLLEAVSNHPTLSKSYRNNFVNLDFLPRFTPKYAGSDISIIYPESEPIQVMASCNDLLLCSHFSTYYVVNLLTRQWIVLPTFPRINEEFYKRKSLILGHHKPGILCFNDEKDTNGDGWYRFKVILVPKTLIDYSPENLRKMNISGRPEILSSKYSIAIFCSETRQWTKVIVDWYPLNLNYCLWYSPILSFDRMVHWIVGSSLVSIDLFSGDPKLSLSRVVKLPDKFVLDESLCFGLCEGRLRIACCLKEEGSGHVIHVWDLEDWRSGSWSLVHKVVLDKLHFLSYLITVVAFHPYKRDIIFLSNAEKIYLFNMQTGKLKLHRKLGKGYNTGLQVDVVPPILHQWFPTPVPSPPPVLDIY